MLTVPEGVCACGGCCWAGLAVSSLASDEAFCSCSVVVYFQIREFDVWLLIVRGTTSHCGMGLVTGTPFVLSNTWALCDSLLIAAVESSLERTSIGLWSRSVCFVITGIATHPLLTSSVCRTISQRPTKALHTLQELRMRQRSTSQMEQIG